MSDTGVGIDPELINNGRIFDAFTQGDSSLKRARMKAWDWGLSLCKSISERLNGSITVESEVRQGFSVLLSAATLINNGDEASRLP